MSSEELVKKFQQLKEAIFFRRPVLKEIIKKNGHKKLYEYGQDYLDVNINPAILERQNEFLGVFEKEAKRTFGDTVALEAVRQLRKYYFVNTADHHGPICHPFFLNANSIIAASYAGHTDPDLKFVITLSCTNISLNNSSFPRGLLFSSNNTGKVETHRLSFLPSNAHAAAVYSFRPYSAEDINKIRHLIKEKLNKKLINKLVAEKLESIIHEVYDRPEILASRDYSDQVSKTNYDLWHRFFAGSRVSYPDLLYVSQENLAVELLLSRHLVASTPIYKILFDPVYESLIDKYFEGIMGAYSRKEKWGTYLFWGVDGEKNFRLHLWRQGNKLVSDDGKFSIELSPAAIREALVNKQIIPSMLLIYLMISLYYGLKCLGGVNQVQYLSRMKDAYIEMQREYGDEESATMCERVQTKEFVDGPTIAYLSSSSNGAAPANGLDILLYDGGTAWEKLISVAKNITLEESFNPLLPEYYSVMYAEVDRVAELSSITSKEIIQLTGIEKKLVPCLIID